MLKNVKYEGGLFTAGTECVECIIYSFCMEFSMLSVCTHAGTGFPLGVPTVQRHAVRLNGDSKLFIDLKVNG